MTHLFRRSWLLLVALCVTLLSACTKYDFVETGQAQAVYPGTMWAYFEAHPYDWSLTVRLARRVGLQSLFEGTSSYGQQITCFGITNHSWRRYLLKLYADKITSEGGDGEASASALSDAAVDELIDQLDESTGRELLLSGVLPGEALSLEQFAPGRASTDQTNPIGTGGKTYTMASGKQLWIYSFRTAFSGVPEAGPQQLFLVSPTTQVSSQVASHNIRTSTGIVHALQYNFQPSAF